MPIRHIVLLKLKAGTTESQIDELYNGLMALGNLPMVESVSAGENFSQRSQGFNFGFELVVSDLAAYQSHPQHVAFKEKVLVPLVEPDGVLACDYEYPRSVATHGIGKEVATPDQQRWDTRHSNEDIAIDRVSISPKGDAPAWRMAVAARPVRSHGYVDFEINLNPKPESRGLEIGIITRKDMDNITERGINFTSFKSGLAWSCNGGYVSGIPDLKEHTVTPVKWEHDHTVGVFVDVEKGVLQFFFDRKKHGPALHIPELFTEKEVFFAVGISTPKSRIDARWGAACPKVFLG